MGAYIEQTIREYEAGADAAEQRAQALEHAATIERQYAREQRRRAAYLRGDKRVNGQGTDHDQHRTDHR